MDGRTEHKIITEKKIIEKINKYPEYYLPGFYNALGQKYEYKTKEVYINHVLLCLSYLNKYDIHWATWSYKVKGNSTWGIFNMHNTFTVDVNKDSYDAIVTKWTDQRRSIQKNTTVYPALAEFVGGKTIH